MIFKTQSSNLLKKLYLINKITNYVKFSIKNENTLYITGENNINRIRIKIEALEASGSEIVLDIKMLIPILNNAKGMITFNKGLITFDGSKFKVPYIEDQEILNISDELINNNNIFDGNSILKGILKVKYAKDKKTPSLNGVYISNNECVAMSGFRLVKYPCCNNNIDATINDELIYDIYKIFYDEKINCCKRGNRIMFYNENFILLINAFNTIFPTYKAFLPKELENKISINKNEILKALEISMATVDSETFKGSFEISNNDIKINTKNIYCMGETIIKCHSEKNHIIEININHFLEAINTFDSTEFIYLNFNDNDNRIIVSSDNSSDYVLLMQYK